MAALLRPAALQTEGLFRVSAPESRLRLLRQQYSEAQPAAAAAALAREGEDVHVVAGVLKWYLRQLPEPLLSFELYEPLVAAAKADALPSSLLRWRRCNLRTRLKTCRLRGSRDSREASVAALCLHLRIRFRRCRSERSARRVDCKQARLGRAHRTREAPIYGSAVMRNTTVPSATNSISI